jgi:hypothetical protein
MVSYQFNSLTADICKPRAASGPRTAQLEAPSTVRGFHPPRKWQIAPFSMQIARFQVRMRRFAGILGRK